MKRKKDWKRLNEVLKNIFIFSERKPEKEIRKEAYRAERKV